MTVVLVLRPAQGGMRRHVLQLAAGLRRHGHSVVLAAAEDPEIERAAQELGCGLEPLRYGRRPDLRDLRSALRLYRVGRHADVVHAHGLRAGLLALQSGLPYLYSLHGFAAGPLERLLEGRVLRRAQGVLSVSQALDRCAAAAGVPSARRRVVPGGIDARSIAAAAPLEGIFRVGARPRIGYLGRLSPEKGVDVLLEAFARLSGDLPTAELAVAGAGPAEQALRRQALRGAAKGRIRFVGAVEDAAAFLRALDIYVQPSRREGQGLAALEALAAGCKVVASAVGGLRENLEGVALLVPPGDPSALAQALRRAETAPLAPADGLRRAQAFGHHRQLAETIAAYQTLCKLP